jgi:glycine cleavage system regulatory protein
MASFVISVLGDDRTGLVAAISEAVDRHGGNWERSHMTQLADKFAGVVLVTVPDTKAEGFAETLESLETQGVLEVAVEEAGQQDHDQQTIEVRIVGNDHPGIVHELSSLLASKGVSIDDLQTDTSSAPMAGGMLFEAVARLRLPNGLDAATVVRDLEAVAADLMVDVEIVDGES